MFTSIELPEYCNPTFTIACDGKSALDKVDTDRLYIKCRDKHVDFISIISELCEQSSFRFIKQHVYGHQDTTGRPLTTLEHLNCKMDLKANKNSLQ